MTSTRTDAMMGNRCSVEKEQRMATSSYVLKCQNNEISNTDIRLFRTTRRASSPCACAVHYARATLNWLKWAELRTRSAMDRVTRVRGPYRRYNTDPSAPIPKTTLWRMRKSGLEPALSGAGLLEDSDVDLSGEYFF